MPQFQAAYRLHTRAEEPIVTKHCAMSADGAPPPAKRARAAPPRKLRVGIVGYGSLGQFLVDAILTDAACMERLELAFVWNRSADKVAADARIPAEARLADLDDFASKGADLVIEVAHPSVSASHGARFLEHADFMCGSPTAFADRDTEAALVAAAQRSTGHTAVLLAPAQRLVRPCGHVRAACAALTVLRLLMA